MSADRFGSGPQRHDAIGATGGHLQSGAARRTRPARPRRRAAGGQAIGSFLRSGRLSQLLPAATMQLRPLGVVLTTVQVFFSSEA